MRMLAALLLLFTIGISAQEKERVLYYPKPIVRDYKAPMKPVTGSPSRKTATVGMLRIP